jgi:murein L,D-transpeptidase YafK
VTSHLFAFVVLLATMSSMTEDKLPSDAKADRVLVMKRDRTLTLMSGNQVLKVYKIALGGDPAGAKQREGDHKTPEGAYVLDRRNAKSKFYRSIHISYPNEKDRKRAQKMGVPPGGDVMVHGLPNGFRWLGLIHRTHDWTDGCIAVTDQEMDEIWNAVPDGTPIEIKP